MKAVAALKPGEAASADEIIPFCKERLAAYKYSRVLDFIDALPKGLTGKISRRQLGSVRSRWRNHQKRLFIRCLQKIEIILLIWARFPMPPPRRSRPPSGRTKA